MKKLLLLLPILLVGQLSAQIPCEDGKADVFDCNNFDLQAHVTANELLADAIPDNSGEDNRINDIWGWTDPTTDKEYALVGMVNGTSFVDISDPINPIILGVLREHNFDKSARHDGAKSIWRDIKVYSDHAYIVSEDPEHGIQVFDLTDLRDVDMASIPVFFNEAGHYDGVGKVHNIVINETTGYAYAVGANSGDQTCTVGGLHMIDLSDPANPVYAGCYDDDGYTHDAQCVIYNGPDTDYVGQEICFNSNENTITFVDVTDKSNPVQLARESYEGVQYTHQGWLTEDHRYFISNDELDELRTGINTTTFIWDVQDLENPTLIGTHVHETKSIDHNLYVVGDLLYESNYSSGLRVFDLVNIADGELNEIGFFDTYLSHNDADWFGSWSNYPYFESGNIVVSDISNGLFIVKPKDIIVTGDEDIFTCVGKHLNFPVRIFGKNLTYRWQVDDGTGFVDIDTENNVLHNERYKNQATMSLHAHELLLNQDGYKFRCFIKEEDGTEHVTEEITLHIEEVPVAGFNYEFDPTTGIVTFENTSTSATEYQWDFGDNLGVNNEEDPTRTFEESGTYDVELIAANSNCSDTITQTLNLVILSADEIPNDLLEIYPIPASDHLTIQLLDGSNGFKVEMFGIDGRLVQTIYSIRDRKEIQLQGLPKGIYYFRITSADKETTRKVLID